LAMRSTRPFTYVVRASTVVVSVVA
jgi:hypothetical protein